MQVAKNKTRACDSEVRNKYVEYRQQYERAKSFSHSLNNSVQDSTQKSPQTQQADSSVANEPITGNVNKQIEQAAREGLISEASAQNGQRIMEKLQVYAPEVKAASLRYNLPEEVLYAVIWQESRGNKLAVSHCGAKGLMQLMPDTARSLGVADAFDPKQNISGGAQHLRRDFDRFGRLDLAVAAYNAGPGAVMKHGGIPPYRETQDYVPKVLGYANDLKAYTIAQNTIPSNAIRA